MRSKTRSPNIVSDMSHANGFLSPSIKIITNIFLLIYRQLFLRRLNRIILNARFTIITKRFFFPFLLCFTVAVNTIILSTTDDYICIRDNRTALSLLTLTPTPPPPKLFLQ